MASFTSSIALLGASNEIYSFGTQFIVKSISYIFGNPIITNFYLPVFYNMKVTSAYEVILPNLCISPKMALCIYTNFSIAVSRKAFRTRSKTFRIDFIQRPDDSLHGSCAVCTIACTGDCNWDFESLLHLYHGCRLCFLFCYW